MHVGADAASSAEPRNAYILERAGIAALVRPNGWRMSARLILQQFRQKRQRPRTEGFIQRDPRPPAGFAIKQAALRDGAAEHLLQAERLCAQLHLVGILRFVRSLFVFYRVRQPQPFAPMQRNTAGVAVELHHVADVVQVQEEVLFTINWRSDVTTAYVICYNDVCGILRA